MSTENLRAQFGKPKTQSSGFKIWRLKGDEATSKEIYRLLPPMKSCAVDGKWAVFHAQHFGYKIKDSTGKEYPKPFGCPKKTDRNKMVIVPCAKCNQIESKKAMMEEREASLKAAGKNDEEIKEILKPLADWLYANGYDAKYYIPVMNMAGEFGVLAIPYKMKKDLDRAINEAKENKNKPVDVFDIDNGRWIHFRRTGRKASEMNFTCDIYKETVNVNGEDFEKAKVSSLSDEQLEKALAEIPDLNTEIVRYLEPEKVEMLVNCSGDPDEVKRIFDSSSRAGTQTREASAPRKPAPAPEAPAKPKEEPKPAPAPTPAPEVDDEEAAALAALEKARAKKAAAEAAKKAEPEATKPAPKEPPKSSKPVDEMSDEEFMKLYGSAN